MKFQSYYVCGSGLNNSILASSHIALVELKKKPLLLDATTILIDFLPSVVRKKHHFLYPLFQTNLIPSQWPEIKLLETFSGREEGKNK